MNGLDTNVVHDTNLASILLQLLLSMYTFKMTQKFLGLLLVLSLVAGCSSGDSGESSSVAPSRDEANTSRPAFWDCESQEDGLGEKYSCSSQSKDSDGNTWVLTIMCTSDGITRNSIVGFDTNVNMILWPVRSGQTIKVRIDSEPIQEWAIGTKAGGQGVSFNAKQSSSAVNSDTNENNGTWKFLTAISSASTFGFQGTNLEGYVESARFEVGNSVPIAAKFASLGCGTR